MAIKTMQLIRRIRDENYNQTKSLTGQERREYYRRKAELAREKARQVAKQLVETI